MNVTAWLFAAALAARSMDTKTFLIGLAVMGVLMYVAYRWDEKRKKKLIGEGKLIERDSGFEENTEDFTIASQCDPIVAPAVRSIPFDSCRAKLVEDDGVTFVIARPKDWKAVLTRTLQDHGTCTYNFRFIQWEDNANRLHMNMLLTAVEKLFLSLDPNVKVHVRKMNVKTTYR